VALELNLKGVVAGMGSELGLRRYQDLSSRLRRLSSL